MQCRVAVEGVGSCDCASVESTSAAGAGASVASVVFLYRKTRLMQLLSLLGPPQWCIGRKSGLMHDAPWWSPRNEGWGALLVQGAVVCVHDAAGRIRLGAVAVEAGGIGAG